MDVYRIGISITMMNGVSSVLEVITRDVLGLNNRVLQAAENLGRLRLAIAGAFSATVGIEMLKGIYDLSKAGEKYTHQLEQMKVAGMTAIEVQKSVAAANQVSSQVPTSTPVENLETIRELRMALASADVRPGGKADPAMATKEAIEHLAEAQKISGILSSTLSKDGKPYDGRGQAFEMFKAAEMLGLTQDPKKMDQVLEGWTQSIIASGGRLQGSDFFGNVKYMRGSGLGMSIDFLTKVLPSLMQEFKAGKGTGAGGGAGNPLASVSAAIVNQQLAMKSFEEYERLHMVDEGKVHRKKNGKVDHLDPGAIIGSDAYAENPLDFIQKVLEPHLREYKKGILDKDKDGNYSHLGDLRAELGKLFGNRVANSMVTIMLTQQSRLAGDRGLMTAAQGIGAYDELIKHDPVLVREALSKQWERIETDLGKAIAPAVTDGLYKLAQSLAYFAEVIERHPVRTKIIFEVAAAIGAVMVVLGSIAMVVAAISGIAAVLSGGSIALLLLGVSAIGFGITELLHYFNGDIGGAIKKFMAGLGDDPIKGALDWAKKATDQVAPGLLNAFKDMLKDPLAFVSDLRKNLLSSLNPDAKDGPADTLNRLNERVAQAGKDLRAKLGFAPAADQDPTKNEGWADTLNRFNEKIAQAGRDLRAKLGFAPASDQSANKDEGFTATLARWNEKVGQAGKDLRAAFDKIDLQACIATLSHWATEISASAKTAFQTMLTAISDGLSSVLKSLTGWFTSLPGRIWSSVSGKESAAPAPVQSSAVAIYMADHPGVTKEAAAMAIASKGTVVSSAPQDQHGQPNAPDQASALSRPNLPPTAQPGGPSGAATDPHYVVVTNQISGHDIARGVSSYQADKSNRPPSGYTGTDLKMDPLGAFYGMVNAPF